MNEKKMPAHSSSLWIDRVKKQQFPKLDSSINTSVAIVGGGITGVTAAYLLAEAGVEVVLIEADHILHGTTGHTTAKVTAQHGLIYSQLIRDLGLDKAQTYYKANEEAMQLIEHLVQEHNIDCAYEQMDAYVYTNEDKYIKKLESEKKAYDKIGIKGELVEEIPLPVPHQLALKMPNQAQFHPLCYLEKLAAIAVDHGTTIYEQTAAVDIVPGDKPRIETRDGYTIECEHVIVASHFPFWDKQGLFFARMEPQRSYVNAIKTSLTYPGGMYISAESPTRSIRKAENGNDTLWLVGGDSHKTGQGKPTIAHYEALQAFAEEHFQATKTVYRWSAQDPITLDHVPYIGAISKEKQNILIATGYAKWGMTQGTVAANHITNLILGKETEAYTALYNPSRFGNDISLENTVSYNADVAKHLIKGKFDFRDADIDDLEKDQAAITRINGKRAGAYKDTENNVHLVDTTCTHLGCEVNWNAGERSWDCPCHGSRFSYTGDVLEGPATKPLAKFKAPKES